MSQPTHVKARRRQSVSFEAAKRKPCWCVRLRNQARFTPGIDHAKTVTVRLQLTYDQGQLLTLHLRAKCPFLFFSTEQVWA